MHRDLFVVGLDHVPENMRSVVVLTFSVAEPFVAIFRLALHHCAHIMDAAIATMFRGELAEVKRLDHHRHLAAFDLVLVQRL